MAKRGNNEGSIHKRENGTWRAQVSIEGKRLSFTANSRAECHDWLRRTMDLIDHGLTLQSRRISLKEYLEEWFEVKKTTLRPRTAYDYQRFLTIILEELGQIKLKDLTTYRTTRFYTKLTQLGKGSRTVRIIQVFFIRHYKMHLRVGSSAGIQPLAPCYLATVKLK